MKKCVVILCCTLCSSAACIYAPQATGNQAMGIGNSPLQEGYSLKMHLQEDTSKTKKHMKIISSEGGTFGYEVYSGNRLLIRQPNIPGMSGNKGFKRKIDAEKVAKLVLEKLEKGMMPPTVEKAEMEKLKVEF